ncbi:MAG: LON peptidase substrate-binding domain-containing protein [Robiginitomaculum sp.]
MTAHYRTLARRLSPDVIPVFPLDGAVLLPGCDLPLNIFEPRYLNMIEDALRADRLIGMVQNAVSDDRAAPSESAMEPLTPIGGLGRIKQFSETEGGRYLVVLRGLKRFSILGDANITSPYRQARVSYDGFDGDIESHRRPDLPKALTESSAERAKLVAAMKGYARTLGVALDWEALKSVPIDDLVDQGAMISPFRPFDKQSLLEADDGRARRRLLIGLMTLYSQNDEGKTQDDDTPRKDLQ